MSWLWKNDTTSPASYEKALSKLSTQITASNLSLDATRARARRIKALWTLYTSVGYILYTLIIALVLGPHKWAVPHYAGLVGAPLLIYGIRVLVNTIFGWSINRQQSHVDSLQKQRDVKIAELKKATKYDTTQELLRKYGESPPKPAQGKSSEQGTKRKISSVPQPQQRTGIAPPPTANIPGRNPTFSPSTPQQRSASGLQVATSPETRSPTNGLTTVSPDEPGFAPNAFGAGPPPSSSYQHAPHWYDRVLDVLLGEDETLAKNRLALICSNCRLVNGQAPPGVKTIDEVGRWRCSSCHSWNGKESPGSPTLSTTSPIHASPVHEEMAERPRSSTLHSNDAHQEHETEEVEASVEEDYDDEEAEGDDHKSTKRTGMTKRVTRSSGVAPIEPLE